MLGGQQLAPAALPGRGGMGADEAAEGEARGLVAVGGAGEFGGAPAVDRAELGAMTGPGGEDGGFAPLCGPFEIAAQIPHDRIRAGCAQSIGLSLGAHESANRVPAAEEQGDDATAQPAVGSGHEDLHLRQSSPRAPPHSGRRGSSRVSRSEPACARACGSRRDFHSEAAIVIASTTPITTSEVEVSISGMLSSCRWPKCSSSLTPMKARTAESPAER